MNGGSNMWLSSLPSNMVRSRPEISRLLAQNPREIAPKEPHLCFGTSLRWRLVTITRRLSGPNVHPIIILDREKLPCTQAPL